MSTGRLTLVGTSVGCSVCWMVSTSVSDTELGFVDGQMQHGGIPQHHRATYSQFSLLAVI